MLRTLKRPGDWGDYNHVVPMELGGTGEETPAAGLAALNGIPANMVGKPNGPIPRREDNTVDPKYLGDLITGMPGIDGDLTILPNQTKEYFITTYDSFLEYNIVAVNGEVVVDRNVIYYTARSLPGIGGFTINGRRISIVISGTAIMTPKIESPVNASFDRPQSLYIVANAFEPLGASDTHLKSDWQLATDAAFTTIVKSNTGSTSSLTMWGLTDLAENTKYYARVRYYGAAIGASLWSPVSTFTTRIGFGSVPEITRPAIGTVLLKNTTFSKSDYVSDIGTIQIPMTYTNDAAGAANQKLYGGSADAQFSTTHVSTDWQISKTSNFAVIVFQGNTGVGLNDWLVENLVENTTYYIRARHNSLKRTPQYASMTPSNVVYEEKSIVGAWGYASVYQTLNMFAPAAPTITSPANNATNLGPDVTIATSAFIGPTGDSHASTDWELSTSATFATIAKSSYADATSKLSWTAGGLAANTTYYARVRYNGLVYKPSAWSTAVSFKTLNMFAPAAPTITSLTGGQINPTSSVTISTSAFMGPTGDTHASTDWEIATDASFANRVNASYNDAINMLTWAVSGLSRNTSYYVRVRYNGVKYKPGNWSETKNFMLDSVIGIEYVTPGTYYYTVPAGVYYLDTDIQAAGGGGKGGARGTLGSYSGGGGGSGGRKIERIPVTPGEVVPIVVGRGGDGSFNTSYDDVNYEGGTLAGGSGENSSVKSSIATGGTGGLKDTGSGQTQYSTGGPGGTPSGRDGENGRHGPTGSYQNYRGGNGGSSDFGSGGIGGIFITPAQDPSSGAYGAGGGGGGASSKGSSGRSGRVFIRPVIAG